MKTHKRDRVERAYNLGYKAGIRGRSTKLCPYNLAETRGSWMGGWRDGRTDLSEGYLDIESV